MYRVAQMKKVQLEARCLFEKKNQDYGDAFANYGPIGVLVRMGDKIQRLQSITKNKVALVKDEKIRDTLIDLHNYSAMAIMLLDEEPVQEPVQDPELEPVQDPELEPVQVQESTFEESKYFVSEAGIGQIEY